MTKKNENEEVKAFLGRGASFRGKLIFSETVRIDGDYEGDIFGEGTLVIGQGAEIKAQIEVGRALISGNVQGNINAKDKVEIHSTGSFFGDIKAPRLVIHEGAVFEGTSCMPRGGDEGGAGKDLGRF